MSSTRITAEGLSTRGRVSQCSRHASGYGACWAMGHCWCVGGRMSCRASLSDKHVYRGCCYGVLSPRPAHSEVGPFWRRRDDPRGTITPMGGCGRETCKDGWRSVRSRYGGLLIWALESAANGSRQSPRRSMAAARGGERARRLVGSMYKYLQVAGAWTDM